VGLQVLNRALEYKEGLRRIYYYLWACYKETGDREKAIEALERYNKAL